MDDGESPTDPEAGRWVLCRRHSPVTFGAANDGYSGGHGIFPRVTITDWCGEWVQCGINTGDGTQRTYLQHDRELFDEYEREIIEP
jgi:hypothetical protein